MAVTGNNIFEPAQYSSSPTQSAEAPALAAAFASASVPEGSVVVDRARFERLLHIATEAQRFSDEAERDVAPFIVFNAADTLKPGDLDPLP